MIPATSGRTSCAAPPPITPSAACAASSSGTSRTSTRDTYGFEFEGTLEDYARLLKVAYLAAKEGNPDAIIHLAGTTYWHDVNEHRRLYVDRLLELLTADPDAAANGYYFDVLTLHIYFRADTVYTHHAARCARCSTSYGLGDKHIWIDETNASPNLDPQWLVQRPQWQITLDQQGAYLAQAAALGLAAGADHIGVYKFYDWSLPPGAESFGLMRADGSRRPAFDTWAMVIQQMNGVDSAVLAQSATADVVRLRRSDGQERVRRLGAHRRSRANSDRGDGRSGAVYRPVW